MIEERLVKYLTDSLTGVDVLMEAPKVPSKEYPSWPDKLVVIERVGGSKTNQMYTASFAFQSYAGDLHAAVALDDSVRTAMDAFWELENIGSAKLSSCYNHTDTRTGRYRYQSTYDIYYREV